MAHKDAVLMPEPSKMQLSDLKNYLFFQQSQSIAQF